MVLRKHLVLLWVLNMSLLVLVLIASFVSDANARLPGIGESASAAVVLCLAGVGTVVDVFLLFLDRRGRLNAIVVGAIYIAMAAPILM